MRRCYRTPGQILTAAHAMGMGLLRPEGMLTGITNKRPPKRDIGDGD
jgi:superfamily I DNA and RNA helicase